MAQIIKTYREHLPALRFIGKRYTNADRINGGYGAKWGEWFQNNWFEELEKLGEVKEIENGYLGLMRCNGRDETTFEYWIGIFLPPETNIPAGYDYIDLKESDIAVYWIKGREDNGEIYSMHEQCIEADKEISVEDFYGDEQNRSYFFERYNCPRFTQADENGEVILDYGIYLM